MSFTFSYLPTGSGWAEISFGDRVAQIAIRVSYLSDALQDLLGLTTLLAEGVSEAECSLYDEPGEYRVRFKRAGNEAILTVRSLATPEGANGELIFQTRQPAKAMVRAILRNADAILQEFTEEQYWDQWKHPFPAQALERLRESLVMLENSSDLGSMWAAEHVRIRPKMYFGEAIDTEVVATLLHDAAQGIDTHGASRIVVMLHPGDMIEVADDGEGVPNINLRGRPRIVHLLSEVTVPHIDERFAVWMIPPVCSVLTIDTISSTGRQIGEFHYGLAVRAEADPNVTSPVGTTFRFRFDRNIIEPAEITKSSLLNTVRRRVAEHRLTGWRDEMEANISVVDLRNS
jgi:hypothetical protein